MPTDHDTQQSAATATDAAGAAPAPDPGPNHTDATAGPSQPHDEASMRGREGLPDNAVILAAPFAITPPMRMPDGMEAMLVVAIDITHEDGTGEVELFAGCWQSHQRPADRVDGDLVLRLDPSSRHPAAEPGDHMSPRSRVDIELLLAYQGRWQRVGLWPDLDSQWPHIVGPTARAILRLHTNLTETAGSTLPVVSPSPQSAPGHHPAQPRP